MSTPTVAARPGTLTATPRPQVGMAELCRLALRQHRIGLLCTVVGYLAFALVLFNQVSIPLSFDFAIHTDQLVPGFAGIVAVFWGAPLLATEYERHTNVFAWSQDTSPGRWLTAKVLVIGGVIAVLTCLLTLAQQHTVGGLLFYDSETFEAWVPLGLVYAAFGFAIGLAAGAVFRRVVPAMGATLVGFVGIRLLVGLVVRPWLLAHLITPLRWVAPISIPTSVPDGSSLFLNFAYLNAAGQPVPAPQDPALYDNISQDAFVRLMHAHGVVQNAIDYQPASRAVFFQLAELAIFLILTAIVVVIAFRAVRRA